LLFIGFAFGLILTAFFYYVPSLFGININQITYIMPIVLIIVGLLINLGNVKKELNE